MSTPAELVARRARFFQALIRHPTWSQQQFADFLGCPRAWVRTWRARFADLPFDDHPSFANRSSARKHPPPRLDPRVVVRILQLRDELPATLHRIPGPKAILYFLHHDRELPPEQQALPPDLRLPRSPTTIWRILRQHQRIVAPPHRQHEPLVVPAPMEEWEADFTDAISGPVEPDGRRQHGAEAFNVVDRSTSTLLTCRVRGDYAMATVIEETLAAFQTHGVWFSHRTTRTIHQRLIHCTMRLPIPMGSARAACMTPR